MGLKRVRLDIASEKWQPTPVFLPGKSHEQRSLFGYSPVQFSRSVMSNYLQPHGSQARLASLSVTNSWSLLKLMSIKLVMPSNRLILSSLFLLPSIFLSIRVLFFFPMSPFFESDSQSIGVSASASVLPMNT